MLVRRCSPSRLDDCSAAAALQLNADRRLRHSSALSRFAFLQLFSRSCGFFFSSTCYPASLIVSHVMMQKDARAKKTKIQKKKTGTRENVIWQIDFVNTRQEVHGFIFGQCCSITIKPGGSEAFAGKSFCSVLVPSPIIWISCFIMPCCRLLLLF